MILIFIRNCQWQFMILFDKKILIAEVEVLKSLIVNLDFVSNIAIVAFENISFIVEGQFALVPMDEKSYWVTTEKKKKDCKPIVKRAQII